MIYFYTANAGPDFDGSVREGDNLFTSSVVALEATTGEMSWYYQTVHHDLWDYDGATPVVLFNANYDGELRKGIAALGKTSFVYLLDRTNGEPLIGIEEQPVPQESRQKTAATQPFPLGDSITPQHIEIAPDGYELVNGGRIFTPYWDKAVVMKPGALGGMNWPPASYDPESQTMYICANDRIHAYRADPVDEFEEGRRFMGGPMIMTSVPQTGIFAALDVTTNKLVWRQQWGDTCYSGSATTAGGLIFVGRNDGRFMALDASDGSWLWEFQTGAGVNAPATVFEHDNQQYVVVYSAGNLFARSAKGDSLWLFALHGTIGPVEQAYTAATSSTGSPFSGIDMQAADTTAGEIIYRQVCAFCHLDDGGGGHDGSPLDNAVDSAVNANTIYFGRDKMPAFSSVYSPEEIRDLGAYVELLAEKLNE